ncbi:hypothetical protein GUJ93_ZPchr0007g3672 [Zizania palustris]|uniref:Major facilitator superfamily (MFS) profile domain-containing protein n=1 Tax=Zizania palustris TaxID=103762 RepID=A0A8J5TFP1_ZIZPA|nr:hypothetical protein GUJ93_ZPchr0007g3672 [Zizania palustris]
MRCPLNKYAFVGALLSSATPLFLGYDLAMVSSTAVLAEADLKLLACIVVVSSLLGALAAVGAQSLFGDRYTVVLSAAVLCTGALARGLATSFTAFTAGILVNGVGMGMAVMIVPAYAAELSPSSLRGVVATHPDGFVYLGCILGSLCYSKGFLKLPVHLAWRLTVASGTAIPALLSFAAVLLMPESPRWLLAKDHVTKARRVLSRTSMTLEETELRLLEIKTELGAPHDCCGDTVAMPAKQSRWREECGVWLELLARPTEPLRRAVVSALVAKVFQQASGIGPMFQHVQRAFRDVGVSSNDQMPRALVALGLVVVASFSMSLVLVELGWLLVKALAASCLRRALSHRPSHTYRGGGGRGMTRRHEQLKWARGLSATMLLSLTALLWIALGPAQGADASSPSSSRGCPQWLRTAAAAVNRAVSTAIFSSFAWLYEVTAVHGSLLVCPAVALLAWLFLYVCLFPAKER